MNPDEIDLADDDLRDTHGRSREDHEADEADRLIKEMKIDGSYWRWRDSRMTHAEFVRDEREKECEAAKAAHAARLAEDRRWDGES